jgi:hypothetical protein
VGTHVVLARASNHHDFERKLELQDGERHDLGIVLLVKRRPWYGTWWFWTTVGGAVAAGTLTALIVPRLSGGGRCDGIEPNCVEFR